VTPLRVLAPHHTSHDICRPHLVNVDREVRTSVFRVLGVSQDLQTLGKLNCTKRKLSPPAQFRGLNVPSLELNDERAHYASFNATLAKSTTDFESESLGHMHGIIRH
jgi:hypothetical protein